MGRLQKTNEKHGPAVHNVLSDRGVHLAQAHQRQQNSNIRTGQLVIVGDNIRVEIGQRCPVCKKRVRGPNHVSGDHHRGIITRRSHR